MALRTILQTATIEQWYTQYNLLASDAGDLSDLETTETDSLVDAINEVNGSISTAVSTANNAVAAVGTLSNLNTTAKSNAVAAINEVNSAVGTVSTNIGTLGNLNTTAKNSIVAALNEANTAATSGNIAASRINSGTLNVDRIPDLAAGKITSGVLASARIPAISFGKLDSSAVLTSGESFADVDNQLMTAAAINNLIESKGYITEAGGEGDITGVTAGNGLTGGGSSGAVTLNIGAGTGINVSADSISVTLSPFSTSNLSEGSNLYYTTARANAAIDTRVSKAFIDALNIDADTLDDIDSGSFLRSDQADTANSQITFANHAKFDDSSQLRVGSGTDLVVYHTSNINYIDLNNSTNGNLIIRDTSGSPANRFTFERATGNFTASGNVLAYSDINLKINLKPIKFALESLAGFSGCYFNWNDTAKDIGMNDESRQLGVIAQEVQRFFPEAVKKDGNGYLTVCYTKLIPVLIQAIKELDTKFESLKDAN